MQGTEDSLWYDGLVYLTVWYIRESSPRICTVYCAKRSEGLIYRPSIQGNLTLI
jgi:hypothetical protein